MGTTAITSTPPEYLPRGVKVTASVLVIGALVAGYQATLMPVTLVIDGEGHRLRTHQDTVGALLTDSGLALHPEDEITPADLTTTLEPGMVVQVQRARPVYICADGHEALFRTHATSVEDILYQARVSLGPYDEVEIEGELQPASRPVGHARLILATAAPEPARIVVHRAVPFTVNDDGRVRTFYTTAATVGESLRRAGLTLYLADGVQPGLGEPMSAGLRVLIDRSVPVAVQVDGRMLRTRTHRERVDEVLADLGVVLTGRDYTTPALDASLEGNAAVRVVRVSERFLIEQEPIPYETKWQPAPGLEIDNQELLQEGARGVLERRIRVRYEDGREVARAVENEYVAVPPTTKLLGFGTKIVFRLLDTPTGPVEYWRRIRVLATSYSASTAGTPKSAAWYGRTRLGLKMRHGIVAVDPRVISLGSQVYVPGYGVGYAGDTGGAIKGRRIDLGYDDDNLVLWYRWVDVYVLTPVPPLDQINYIIGP